MSGKFLRLFLLLSCLCWVLLVQAQPRYYAAKLLRQADSVYNLNDYTAAHRLYLEALQQHSKLPDCRVSTRARRGIGACYYYLHEKQKALVWFRDYMNEAVACSADSLLSDAYYLLNVLFIEQGVEDSLNVYAPRAIALMKSNRQFARLSQLYSTLAEFHIQTSRKQDEIIRNLELAEAYAQEAKDSGMLAFANMKRFNYHFYFTQNYRLALEPIGEALKLYERLGNVEATTNAYRAKAECLAMLGDTLAVEYMRKWFLYKDSVFDQEMASALARYEILFESSEKEEQLRLQKEKLQKEKMYRRTATWITVSGLFLLSLLALILFQRSRHRTESLLREENERRIREVFAAEQAERIRIARDLHDSIGQKLAVIRMLIPDKQPESEKLHNYLDEATDEVREIAHNLIPEILRFGLEKAIQGLVDRINSSDNLNVEYKYSRIDSTVQEPDRQTALSVYRIVQELLGNMVRHSGADRIRIFVEHQQAVLHLELSDNGRGFHPDQIENSTGMGWNNIFTRIKLVNGKLKIKPGPGKGSEFFIEIPVNP